MGYKVKIQKVQRPTNKSFYLNMPSAVAEALCIEKGEEFEWTIEDKNTLVLKRVVPLKIDNRANNEHILDPPNQQVSFLFLRARSTPETPTLKSGA